MKLRKITAILLSVMISAGSVYAHPGRTDSNGGHHDYKNKSGLGSYHYHCGGYPAHLHPNGVCPYKSSSTSTSSSSSSSSSSYTTTKTTTVAENPNKNNVYLMHTMPQMTVGESFTASAVSNNSSASLSWSSSNPSVASVDSYTGTVTAKSVGTAVITVTNGHKSASYTVTCKGYIAYTNTECLIDGKAIQLYTYGVEYYVNCNSLNSYGFDVTFTKGSESSIVKIIRNGDKMLSPIDVVSYPEGKVAYEAQATSINVICENNTAYSKSVNGEGRMFVAFDSLATFGSITKGNGKIQLNTY